MDDKMEARLGDEVIVAGYQALPDVYEWLIPDAKLTPEGSVAALGDLVQSLPSNARVLDCSSGTGQFAVGLAHLGLDVVATDASAGMVRRTQELADEHSIQRLRTAISQRSRQPSAKPSSPAALTRCSTLTSENVSCRSRQMRSHCGITSPNHW